jgi:post-segregation antitoxin (ccd killing protein)
VAELKTWQETYDEACLEQRVDDVLITLRVRGIAVPAAARRRIAASKDQHQLRLWLRRAAVAASIDEVFDDKPRRPPRTARRGSAR